MAMYHLLRSNSILNRGKKLTKMWWVRWDHHQSQMVKLILVKLTPLCHILQNRTELAKLSWSGTKSRKLRTIWMSHAENLKIWLKSSVNIANLWRNWSKRRGVTIEANLLPHFSKVAKCLPVILRARFKLKRELTMLHFTNRCRKFANNWYWSKIVSTMSLKRKKNDFWHSTNKVWLSQNRPIVIQIIPMQFNLAPKCNLLRNLISS